MQQRNSQLGRQLDSMRPEAAEGGGRSPLPQGYWLGQKYPSLAVQVTFSAAGCPKRAQERGMNTP